jgi:DNA-directed RNA polymerase II subunit RPB2
MNDWSILDLYFKDHKYPFTNHHLDSYRQLIKTYIPQTIKSYNPITMIKLDEKKENEIMKVNVYIGGKNTNELFIDHPIAYEDGHPKIITPNDARLKSITYETHIYANVLIEIFDERGRKMETTIKNVAIGSIPIMLHSDICILNGNGNKVIQRLGECIYDGGGYFIIDGKEKVIVAQETETTNCLIIGKLKDDDNFSYKGKIKCSGETGETLLAPRTVEFFLVKSDEDVTEKFNGNKGAIYVSLPSIDGKIPLFILFRALGIESDKEIFETIFGINNSKIEDSYFSNFIRPSVYNNYYEKDGKKFYIYSQEEAFDYIKFRTKYQTIDQVKYLFTVDIFPNIAQFSNKGKYLGYLTKEFINVALNIKKESDRDNYNNKRINISGFLLAELFQEAYMNLRKTIRDTMDFLYYYGSWRNTKDYSNFINKDNIYKLIPVVLIANTFAKSLKGRWGLEADDDPELGRVQDLSRISYIGFLSHLRRVNMPIDRSLKITSPHKLHCHQYGIMCPFETPDGAAVGYLKNLAILTKVTAGTNPEYLRACLLDIGVIPIENYSLKLDKNITKVFVNNNWFGITNDPIKIVRTLRAYKRNALINILTSIYWSNIYNEIKIFTEAGRAVRPLIIINKGKSKLFTNTYNNWFDMIIGKYNNYTKERNEEIYYKNEYINPRTLKIDDKNFSRMTDEMILSELEKEGAVIEYIDPQESDCCFIAMTKENVNNFHTHLEIHPSTMLSVVTANIPMCNHNQSARNVFHAAQTKQAIGIYATNFNKRFDTFGFVQHYPQKAIINTRHAQYTGSDTMANGANLIVAIMTYTGFNQEDSLIINKRSIERGLFHLSYYKSITETSKKINDYERVVFRNPLNMTDEKGNIVKVSGIKHADYSLLDENGIIKEGSYVPLGVKAIVIGKVLIKDVYKEVKRGLFIEQIKETTYTDVSITTDESYYGYINKTFMGTKTNDDDIIVCKVRFLKIKKPEFGDKHSSRHGQKGVVGMILPDEQMPFTKDGIRPDLIVNPHAIPSRMTIGHLVECVYSKLCCLEGFMGDGTVFINLDYNSIYNHLEKHNYDKYGNEILYNGQTGRQMTTEIFIGPTYYFRLKHMVAEKINARGFGSKLKLTRQPTGGRRNGGGLRIGEMERDSLISHGISHFINESMMERSDKYRWCVCKTCGTIPIYGEKIKEAFCKNCGRNEINIIETPYTLKLLKQEFEGMGVEMRINCDYLDMPIEEPLEDDDENNIYVDIDDLEKEENEEEEKPTVGMKKIKKLIMKDKKEKEEEKPEENNYSKMKKPELVEIVKLLYSGIKNISSKNKEDLIKLILAKKEAFKQGTKETEKPEEEKKRPVETGKGKTKDDLRNEIKKKYPDYPLKAAMSKEDLIEILNKSEKEIAEIIANKKAKKRGGGETDDEQSGEVSSVASGDEESDGEASGDEKSDGEASGDEVKDDKSNVASDVKVKTNESTVASEGEVSSVASDENVEDGEAAAGETAAGETEELLAENELAVLRESICNKPKTQEEQEPAKVGGGKFKKGGNNLTLNSMNSIKNSSQIQDDTFGGNKEDIKIIII